MTKEPTLADFSAACDYPGTLNESLVEKSLAEYLSVLGVERKIQRLPVGWKLNEHPSLERSVNRILDDFTKRNPNAVAARAARAAIDAIDARAARDAIDARDAIAAIDARAARAARDAISSIDRFAAWCVQSSAGWWWRWELSWISTTWFGAKQTQKASVTEWAKPVLDAFLAGAWILYWTDDTLYWVSKPTVHTEKTPQGNRLHNDKYAALESDVKNIYFWHGVMVPAFVVVKPEWITIKHIETEENAEIRRVMIEQYGQARYLVDSGAEEVSRDDFGTLYRKPIQGDEPLVMVKVVNSTPEQDGSFKDYFLRVHPECRPLPFPHNGNKLGEPQELTAHNAVASTFGKRGSEYAPCLET